MFSSTSTTQNPGSFSSSSVLLGHSTGSTDTVKQALQHRFQEYRNTLDPSSSILSHSTNGTPDEITDDRITTTLSHPAFGASRRPPHHANSAMTRYPTSYKGGNTAGEASSHSGGGEPEQEPHQPHDHSSKLQHLLQLRAAHILNRDPSLPVALSTASPQDNWDHPQHSYTRPGQRSSSSVETAAAGLAASSMDTTRYSDPMTSSIEQFHPHYRPHDSTLPTAVLSSNASARDPRDPRRGEDHPSHHNYNPSYRPMSNTPEQQRDLVSSAKPCYSSTMEYDGQDKRDELPAPPPKLYGYRGASEGLERRGMTATEMARGGRMEKGGASRPANPLSREEDERRQHLQEAPPTYAAPLGGGTRQEEEGSRYPTSLTGDSSHNGSPASDLFPNDHQIALELRSAHTLLRRYRQDNDRLRSQLAASDLRQAWLTKRLEEVILNSSRSRSTLSAAPDGEVGATVAEGGSPSEGVAKLRQAHARIQELEDHVSDLQGRMIAYEEALRRPQSAAHSPAASESEKDSAERLHYTLSRCWSLTSYLVKVFNAVSHVRSVGHAGDHQTGCSVSGGNAGQHPGKPGTIRESCDHPRAFCATQCLRAALRGSIRSESALQDERARCYAVPTTTLSSSVLEELVYCEERCVKLAGEMLETYASTPLHAEKAFSARRTIGTAASSRLGEYDARQWQEEDEEQASSSGTCTPKEANDSTDVGSEPSDKENEVLQAEELPRQHDGIIDAEGAANDHAVRAAERPKTAGVVDRAATGMLGPLSGPRNGSRDEVSNVASLSSATRKPKGKLPPPSSSSSSACRPLHSGSRCSSSQQRDQRLNQDDCAVQ